MLDPARFTRPLVLLLALAAPVTAGAQAADVQAASTIRGDDLVRHIAALTHDSVGRRTTPSPGLERAAQYVAQQFKALGLFSDNGTWIQRYEVPGTIDVGHSHLRFVTGTMAAMADFASNAILAGHTVPTGLLPKEIAVVSGHQTPETLNERIRDAVVLYIPSVDDDVAQRLAIVQHLQDAKNWVIILADESAAAFAERRDKTHRDPTVRFDDQGAFYIYPDGVANLTELLATVGLDLARSRADTTPIVRLVSGMRVTLDPNFSRPPSSGKTAPNVVGVIGGSDALLRNEYIVITAHLDERPARDSLDPGFDDNVAGAAGLIALAKALTQPGSRPRRSVMLVATSGGTERFWGTHAVARRLAMASEMAQILSGDMPTLSGGDNDKPVIRLVVANLTLDMIGRATNDSVTIDGISDVTLDNSPSWITAAHPELGLVIVEGGTAIAPTAEQFPMTLRGIPSLLLHNGFHGDPADTASAALDTARAARIIRLAFYLTHVIANADRVPRWSAAGRQRFLSAADRD